MKVSKEVLKQALRESASREFAAIPATDSEIEYAFSPQFEAKMKRLIRARRRTGWVLVNTPVKKIVLIAAILIALLAAGFALPPVRDAISGFFISSYSDHIDVEPSDSSRTEIEHEYSFSENPEGFTLSDRLSERTIVHKAYTNLTGDQILLTQSSTGYYELSLDNERGKIWSQTVGARGVTFYQYEDLIMAF